jgi:hypothetical protein
MNEEKYIIFEAIEDVFGQKSDILVNDLNFLIFNNFILEVNIKYKKKAIFKKE